MANKRTRVCPELSVLWGRGSQTVVSCSEVAKSNDPALYGEAWLTRETVQAP